MLAENGTMQIGLTSWDGKEIRQLTRTGDFNTRAAFSPDGKYLAFIRGLNSPAHLMIVNIETGKETLIATDAQSSRPIWRTVAESKEN